MSSTIASGSDALLSEESEDSDIESESVDSEQASSDDESAATQVRPVAEPEPPAPIDLSVIRELSGRMDASLARLLLRYPPTYSVDPGIDSALEGYHHGSNDEADDEGSNDFQGGGGDRFSRRGRASGSEGGNGGRRDNAGFSRRGPGYSSRQHAMDKGNIGNSEKFAALEITSLNTAKSREYEFNFGDHAKRIIGSCAPLLPNRAEVLVAHAVAAWTTLPDTFDKNDSDVKKGHLRVQENAEIHVGEANQAVALSPDPMVNLPFVRPPGAHTREGDWNRRLLVIAKGVAPPPARREKEVSMNEPTQGKRPLEVLHEDAIDEQLAGHLDEIDQLKGRLATMEKMLQTQQQKLETESELNAFLDKRSYEVRDLKNQLAKHEASLDEARRNGATNSITDAIQQAELRISQLERERNSGSESMAGRTALDARIGRLEESATSALQEQLSKTTMARDQAEGTLSDIQTQMQGMQTAGLQQPIVAELQRLKAEREALLATIQRLKGNEEEESALRLQKLERELENLQQQSPRSGPVGQMVSNLRSEIRAVQDQQAKLVAVAAHQSSQSSLSTALDANALSQHMLRDATVRRALQDLSLQDENRISSSSRNNDASKQLALQAILTVAARANMEETLEDIKREEQPGPGASTRFRQHLLESIAQVMRQKHIAGVNTTALLEEPTIRNCLELVESQGFAGAGVGGLVRQMANLSGISGTEELDEVVEDVIIDRGVHDSVQALHEHGDRRRLRRVAIECVFIGAIRTHRLRNIDSGQFMRGKNENERRAEAQSAASALEQRTDVSSAFTTFEDCSRYLSSADSVARAEAEFARQHAVAVIIHASDTTLGSISAASGGAEGAARAFVEISKTESTDAEDRAKGLLLEDAEVMQSMNDVRPVKVPRARRVNSGSVGLRSSDSPLFAGFDSAVDDIDTDGKGQVMDENGIADFEPGPATSAALRHYLVEAVKYPFEEERAMAHNLQPGEEELPRGPDLEWDVNSSLIEVLDAVEGGIEHYDKDDNEEDADISETISTIAQAVGDHYKTILSRRSISSASEVAKADSNIHAIADALRDHGTRRNRRIEALGAILAAVRRTEPHSDSGLLPGNSVESEAILELEGRPEVRDAFSSLERVDDRGTSGRAVAEQQRLATVVVVLRALEEGSRDEAGFGRIQPRKSAAEIDRRARSLLKHSSDVITSLERLKPINLEKWHKARAALRVVAAILRETRFEEDWKPRVGAKTANGNTQSMKDDHPSEDKASRLRRYLIEAVKYSLREKAEALDLNVGVGNSDIAVNVDGDPVLVEILNRIESMGGSPHSPDLSAAVSDIALRVAVLIGWGDLRIGSASSAMLIDVSKDTNVLAVATALSEHAERWRCRVTALKAMITAIDRERISAGRPNGARGQRAMSDAAVSEVATSIAQMDGRVQKALATLEKSELKSKSGTTSARAVLEKARLDAVSAVMDVMEGVVKLEDSARPNGTRKSLREIVETAIRSDSQSFNIPENELALRARELLKRDAGVQDSLKGFKPRSASSWKRVMVMRRLLPGIRAADIAAGDSVDDLSGRKAVTFPTAETVDIDIDQLASDERVEEALRTLSNIEKEETKDAVSNRDGQQPSLVSEERVRRRQDALREILRAAKKRALQPAPSYSTLGGYPNGGAADDHDDDADDDAGEHLSINDALARLGVGIPSTSPFALQRSMNGSMFLGDANDQQEERYLDFGSPRSQFDRSVGKTKNTTNQDPLSQPIGWFNESNPELNGFKKGMGRGDHNNDEVGWLLDFYSNTPNVVHHLDEKTHHKRVLHAVGLIHREN